MVYVVLEIFIFITRGVLSKYSGMSESIGHSIEIMKGCRMGVCNVNFNACGRPSYILNIFHYTQLVSIEEKLCLFFDKMCNFV